MSDLRWRLRHEATSKEPGFMEQGSHASERYKLLMEAEARIERLEADLSEFRNAAADEMIKLRAEIERLTQQKAGQK